MSTFAETQWADAEFSRDYIENADHYIPQRQELFRRLRSFYRFFIAPGPTPASVCDLGCGDGVLTEQLLQEHRSHVILIDGSPDMIEAARKRLGAQENLTFVERSFQELLSNRAGLPQFNFIMSGFAIHHLTGPERASLYKTLHGLMAPGGWFVNIDVVLAQAPDLVEWQYRAWQEWIDERVHRLHLSSDLLSVPQKARANPDNKYCSLEEQMSSLKAAGFERVECLYRHGLFGIYGGQRPEV